MTRSDLPDILYNSLQTMGGSSNIVDICRFVWDHYETDLRASGDLFYTWQYDIRWAATSLRKEKRMKDSSVSPSGIWEIV